MEPYINIYKDVLTNKYAQFEGRSGLREFWSFALVNFLASIALGIIGNIIGSDLPSNLYTLLVLVPGLAIGARRLHDINKSGWWQLLVLLPIIGWLILLIWFIEKGTIGTNQFGSEVAVKTIIQPTHPTPPTTTV